MFAKIALSSLRPQLRMTLLGPSVTAVPGSVTCRVTSLYPKLRAESAIENASLGPFLSSAQYVRAFCLVPLQVIVTSTEWVGSGSLVSNVAANTRESVFG